jgi:DNA-binding phage protein
MKKKMSELREKLKIPENALDSLNNFILDEDNPLINNLLQIIEKYGGIEEINNKAKAASNFETIYQKLEIKNSDYIKDLEWLIEKRDTNSFVKISDYRKQILGERYSEIMFEDSLAVTLELSSCQYFPFLIDIAKDAIENQKLIPGRIIRVRKMKEQEDDGDLLAMTAAMQIIGASYVETLDTKGTAPGSDELPINIHLGGPDTITGYFGGVGQPNDYALKWVDEFIYYYTNYGVKQVLNVNPGTVLLGYFMYKLGINNEFKISVFMGNDNPYSSLWTLLTAKLFAREDGSSPLIGYNLSNSVNNQTIELSAYIRKKFDFEDVVRLEHHITETWKSIVRQPYDRRDELVELAKNVKNISAKHEGGNVEVEETRDYPSDILDYFRDKQEIIDGGHWESLRLNHRDRYDAVNTTAKLLTENGIAILAARNLHHRE